MIFAAVGRQRASRRNGMVDTLAAGRTRNFTASSSPVAPVVEGLFLFSAKVPGFDVSILEVGALG